MSLNNPASAIGWYGMELSYTSATTLSISAGAVVIGGQLRAFAAGGGTFADLDTGAEAVGTNYYVYALAAGGYKISVSASAPTGYTTSNSALIGWFHNDPSSDISKWSVASGNNVDYPRRGPKPGMVMHPSGAFGIDIYIASNSGGAGNGLHSGVNAAASAYNATPWASINQFNAMRACANAGKRLCSNEEWNAAALGTPAGANNNTTCWTAGANIGSNPTGTLPNCKSHLGVYDMTGNVWEWVAGWYALTDVATNLTGWAWTSGSWTAEAEGGEAYTPYGAATGPDGLQGPRAWFRGGGWYISTSAGGWSAGGFSPRYAGSNIGFRCCA